MALLGRYTLFAKKLGEGGGGVVFEGLEKSTKTLVAIKIIDKGRCFGVASRKTHMKEVAVLERANLANHPNVMKLYDFYEEPHRYILVLQHAKGGDLFDRIVSRGAYSEAEARLLITQLLRAVASLHCADILHRDIKPENILLKSSENDVDVLLCDFGLSTFVSPGTRLDTNVGTLRYRAPEMFAEGTHGCGVDVWSIGVVLYILLTGVFPFDHDDDHAVAQLITTTNVEFPPHIWGNISAQAIDLVRHMLERNPAERYSIDDALAHPWMHSQSASLVQSMKSKLCSTSRKLRVVLSAVRMAVRMRLSSLKRQTTALTDVSMPNGF